MAKSKIKMLRFQDGEIFVQRNGQFIQLHVGYTIQDLTVKEAKELISTLKDAILDRIE